MIANLGYVVLRSSDVATWRAFGTDVIGAMEASPSGSVAALKFDNHPFRLLVEPGEADRLAAIGWDMGSEVAFDAMRAHLATNGVAVREGTTAEVGSRCVTALFVTSDPAGNPLEFYHGRTDCGAPFVSPAGVSGFVTGEMGLGHIVISGGSAMEETHAFYREVLGFGDSDDLTMTLPGDGAPQIRVRFLHAANPRHHNLAVANLPSASGVIHLMVEMQTVDDVGRCHDRVLAAGWKLMATLGRHCNDHMFSFYVNGPGGVPIEIGCEGLQLDWSGFEPTVSTVPDFWGHNYSLA